MVKTYTVTLPTKTAHWAQNTFYLLFVKKSIALIGFFKAFLNANYIVGSLLKTICVNAEIH